MKRLSISFFLVIVFIFKGSAFFYCSDNNELDDKWEQLHTNCCELSAQHWKLISWYFQRVGSYLNITEIVREDSYHKPTLYMSDFLKDLFRYTELEYYTNRVCYCNEDEEEDEDEPYNNTLLWHAEFSKTENSTYYVQDHKMNVRSPIFKKYWNREDEPTSGAVVLADRIETLDHFVNGETRLPFISKRSFYVIIIYRKSGKDWDKYASSILSKLWKLHGILNAIIIASCKRDNVSNLFIKVSICYFFNHCLNSLESMMHSRTRNI